MVSILPNRSPFQGLRIWGSIMFSLHTCSAQMQWLVSDHGDPTGTSFLLHLHHVIQVLHLAHNPASIICQDIFLHVHRCKAFEDILVHLLYCLYIIIDFYILGAYPFPTFGVEHLQEGSTWLHLYICLSTHILHCFQDPMQELVLQ